MEEGHSCSRPARLQACSALQHQAQHDCAHLLGKVAASVASARLDIQAMEQHKTERTCRDLAAATATASAPNADSMFTPWSSRRLSVPVGTLQLPQPQLQSPVRTAGIGFGPPQRPLQLLQCTCNERGRRDRHGGLRWWKTAARADFIFSCTHRPWVTAEALAAAAVHLQRAWQA
eukprot:1155522-Pelagomonas_calceolata.AAC.3